jgi:hypothetical protein
VVVISGAEFVKTGTPGQRDAKVACDSILGSDSPIRGAAAGTAVAERRQHNVAAIEGGHEAEADRSFCDAERERVIERR